MQELLESFHEKRLGGAASDPPQMQEIFNSESFEYRQG